MKRQGKWKQYSVAIIVLTFPYLNNLFQCNFEISQGTETKKSESQKHSRPKAKNLQNFFSTHFSWPLEIFKITLDFFFTVGQNNYGNKIPELLLPLIYTWEDNLLRLRQPSLLSHYCSRCIGGGGGGRSGYWDEHISLFLELVIEWITKNQISFSQILHI